MRDNYVTAASCKMESNKHSYLRNVKPRLYVLLIRILKPFVEVFTDSNQTAKVLLSPARY